MLHELYRILSNSALWINFLFLRSLWFNFFTNKISFNDFLVNFFKNSRYAALLLRCAIEVWESSIYYRVMCDSGCKSHRCCAYLALNLDTATLFKLMLLYFVALYRILFLPLEHSTHIWNPHFSHFRPHFCSETAKISQKSQDFTKKN